MKAKVLPLRGKYYGTEVGIIYDDSRDFDPPTNCDDVIQIWLGAVPNYKPSQRELVGYVQVDGVWASKEFLDYYERNAMDDPWWNRKATADPELPAQSRASEWEYEICDNHYETVTSYRIANLIAAAINEGVVE